MHTKTNNCSEYNFLRGKTARHAPGRDAFAVARLCFVFEFTSAVYYLFCTATYDNPVLEKDESNVTTIKVMPSNNPVSSVESQQPPSYLSQGSLSSSDETAVDALPPRKSDTVRKMEKRGRALRTTAGVRELDISRRAIYHENALIFPCIVGVFNKNASLATRNLRV